MIAGKGDIGADMILYSSQYIDSDNYIINYLVEEKGKEIGRITKEDIKGAFTEIYS